MIDVNFYCFRQPTYCKLRDLFNNILKQQTHNYSLMHNPKYYDKVIVICKNMMKWILFLKDLRTLSVKNIQKIFFETVLGKTFRRTLFEVQ